jgi:hypothetical protein
VAIPKFIKRYIDEIPGNGILTDSKGEGWGYRGVHNQETKFFLCTFTYMGVKVPGAYATSIGNPVYYIKITEYDTNPRITITVTGSENAWKQITTPATDGTGEIVRTFRKWKRAGGEQNIFLPTNKSFYSPYLAVPWYLCKGDVFTKESPVIIGPWLAGWSRTPVTPKQFHWVTHARSDGINGPEIPSASASFVDNIQSIGIPELPPPPLWANGPATDTEITHNGVQYKVLAGKPFESGNKNIWVMQLRKVGSTDGADGFKGPGSAYGAGYYEYEFNTTSGELVTTPAGHQLRLKLLINKKANFEVYYFDTSRVGGVNTVPIEVYSTNSQQFINNITTPQSVEEDASGEFTSYSCLNAQEVLPTNPFAETSSSEGFVENLVQDDTTYGDTCVGDECTDCPDCPEDCYECRVFADGEEIADAGFSLAKSGDDCSCKLEVANLNAKRCKGRVAITGDLLDSSGFAQNFCSIIDDTDSTKIKVKCNRV